METKEIFLLPLARVALVNQDQKGNPLKDLKPAPRVQGHPKVLASAAIFLKEDPIEKKVTASPLTHPRPDQKAKV